jgi:hypothetical protein
MNIKKHLLDSTMGAESSEKEWIDKYRKFAAI